jgi:hypothetical protein
MTPRRRRTPFLFNSEKVSHPTHVRRGVFESVSQERCGVDSDSISPYGTRIFLPKKEENSAREISQWMMEAASSRLKPASQTVSQNTVEKALV